MTATSTSASIDTRILGKDLKNSGGNLEMNPWRGWKLVWINCVGAVSSELRDNMKTVEAARAATPVRVLTHPVQHQAMQLAYMLTQVLEGMALVMIMNVEDGDGFEMWDTLVQHFELDFGSHNVGGLRGTLGYKFRSGEWRGYMEDLQTFELKIKNWKKTSGKLPSDGVM